MSNGVPLSNKVLPWLVVGVYLVVVALWLAALCTMFVNGTHIPTWMVVVGGAISFLAYPASGLIAELETPKEAQE